MLASICSRERSGRGAPVETKVQIPVSSVHSRGHGNPYYGGRGRRASRRTGGVVSKVQVAIIGAGPSGLLLSQLLHTRGIESIVLERHTREYVEARIRAGLLEWGTVDLLNQAGVGARMMREGLAHEGVELAFDCRAHRIDLKALTGQRVMVYGQTELQKDLADARTGSGGCIVWEAKDVAIDEFAG